MAQKITKNYENRIYTKIEQRKEGKVNEKEWQKESRVRIRARFGIIAFQWAFFLSSLQDTVRKVERRYSLT